MFRRTAGILALSLLAACGAENRTGQPETETTGTVQAAQDTSAATATTTGISGGTVSALSPADKEFLAAAGMGGLFEVQAGNLALQRGSSADVKSFAERMVNDHGTANAELAQLATAKGTALPTELDGPPEAALHHLSSLSGAEFDKAYMQHMVEDHDKDVSLFDTASTSATDDDVRDFANKTLPILREHQTLAKALARRL